jgi:hypothetical protein
MLDDRDFETLLISESIEASEWDSFAKLSVLQSTAENAFKIILHYQPKTYSGFPNCRNFKKRYLAPAKTLLEAIAALLKTAACNISIYTTCCKYFIPAEFLQQICQLTFSN